MATQGDALGGGGVPVDRSGMDAKGLDVDALDVAAEDVAAEDADVDTEDVDADDDEALRWEGDDDRGQIRPARRGAGILPGDPADDELPDDEPAAPTRPVRTALTAVFALVYLLATLGWILSVQRAGSSQTELVFAVLDQFGMFTAIVAAPLWFGAVLTLTRDSRTLTRIGWLALGAGILVPWPLLLAVLATAGDAS